MKLTKKLQAEVLNFYNAYSNAFFKGDVKTLASFFDDNCHVVGSSIGEVFKDKKSLLKYLKETIRQIKGKAEIRNRNISVMASGNNIMINDHYDFYLLIDDVWTFYGHGRASILISKKGNKWKIIHIHRSLPDSKAEKGEQLATKKIKAENIQLREAVKRRTIELEEKNRELEIESAMERVRTVAMGIKKREDMLKICKTISLQLQRLGVKEIRNIQTAIIYEKKGIYRNFEYYTKHKKTFITDVDYSHPVQKKNLSKMLEGRGAFFYTKLQGKKLKNWYTYQKTTNVFIDTYLQKASSLNYYWYSLGSIAIGISSYSPLIEKDLDLFKRFRNVFELAYRRYLDIEKAEAQTREKEIELGLERVRARAMAMQNSDELAELVSVVFKELTHLGFALTSCIIWIHEHTTDTLWIASAEMNKPAQPYQIKPFYNDFFSSIIHAWKANDPKWVYALTGTEKKNFEKAFFKELPDLPGALRKALRSPKQVVFSASFNNFGALEIVETEPLTDEKFDILHRFGKVFNASYTRFNDLKKAEAQAREAQIEAAMEKIRSRSLAMHQSNELKDVIAVFFERLNELKVLLGTIGIYLYDQKTKNSFMWVGNAIQDPQKVNLPFDEQMMQEDNLLKDMWYAVRNGADIINQEYSLEQKDKFFNYIFLKNDYTQIPEAARAVLMQLSNHIICLITEKNSALFADSFTGEFFSDEQIKILKRAAKVFEQAYIRFLDLQKAEVQAREAKIEAALERVRSVAMGMYKQGDLMEICKVVYVELRALGFSELRNTLIDTFVDKENYFIDYDYSEFTGGTSSKIPYSGNPVVEKYIKDIRKSGEAFSEIIVKGVQLEAWKKFRREHGEIEDSRLNDLKALYYYKYSIGPGGIGISTFQSITVEQLEILKRFRNVFDLSYKRYTDISLAEARAREAQIEAALEKVRSRSLAMHKAEELGEVATVVFEKLRELDIPVADGVAIVTHIEGSKDQVEWMENPGMPAAMKFFQPYYEHPILADYWKAKNEGLDFIAPKYTAEQSRSFFEHIFEHTDYKHTPREIKDYCLAAETYSYFAAFQKNSSIFINNYSGRSLTEPEIDIVKRFSKVFEQAYVRFLDLQKAEAQAREAEIQLALERVRARTMAMHKSEELAEVAAVLFQQLNGLGNSTERINIGIVNEAKGIIEYWATDQDGHQIDHRFNATIKEPTTIAKVHAGWKENKKSMVVDLTGDELKEWMHYLLKELKMPFREELIHDRRVHTVAFFSHGMLLISTPEPVPQETINLLERFANVFEQTYTRFLDLQKAEAQAREAQIEAALERVRSRSIAMRKSEEIADIAGKIFSELRQLNLVLNRVLIWTFNDAEKYITWWSANPEVESNAESYRVDYNDQPVFINFLKAWQERKPVYLQTLSGDDKRTWEEHLFANTELSKLPMPVRKSMREEGTIFTTSVISDYGLMMVGSFEPLSDANIDITQRFGRVFQQSYTRYLDVQKAEAQAREAQIEAALERVRAKAMAMHKSEDFNQAVKTIFDELDKLHMGTLRCGIGILYRDKRTADVWTTAKSETGTYIQTSGDEAMDIHPLLQGDFDAWLRQEDYSYILEGKDLENYYRVLTETNFQLPESASFYTIEKDYKQYYYATPFESGTLFAFRESEFTSEARIVMKRFASVFNLTYKRFLDLQKAEAQAREAHIEAGLERVRSASLSMETTSDLQKVVDIVFVELNKLDIGMDHTAIVTLIENSKDYDVWVGSADANFTTVSRIPYNSLTQVQRDYNDMIEKRPSVLSKVYTGETKKEYSRYLFSQTGFKNNTPEKELRLMMDGDSLITSIVMLENTGIQIVSYKDHKFSETDETILKRFTNVFEQAYIRFLDLQMKEIQAKRIQEEKSKLEKTLSELQAAQKQLIQTEKMASLGELTAGIAHEIQNPLNFVNNFSDVSNELLEEMKSELEKGNTEDVKAIVEDVKQNLEKILHHGKRADGIVKGMLQHSRSSSGQKELVDINVLADEYLRLAYHGLRAKDKSFNAKFETDFDNSIEKISVVPQEIGRVILNLINNAFYAVSEKKKQQQNGYEATVVVSTKKIKDKIEINVKDNGNGIPQNILDKIFQPFFTTKPTGSGTGLGLSLSYDIIKAHDGELKVQTKEGEGSTFVIEIPFR